MTITSDRHIWAGLTNAELLAAAADYDTVTDDSDPRNGFMLAAEMHDIAQRCRLEVIRRNTAERDARIAAEGYTSMSGRICWP
jgi:hypothetical protein